MSGTLRDIGLVLLFIVVGGLFVLAEMALISLRDSQAKALKDRGRRGATVARLNADPNRFLAAVQVGVTSSGFLSAAFGGATLAGRLAPVFSGWGMSPTVAYNTALVVITLVISYVSLVVGELVPKRLGLQRAESISLWVAPTVDRIAKLARPVIWVLSTSTNVVVRLLGADPKAQREQITDAEILQLVSGSATLGSEERQIVEEVFEAGNRQIRELMVPRTEVDFMSAQMPAYKAAQFARERPHSRYPVIRESSDDVIGFVHVRDLFNPELAGRSVRVREVLRDVLMLPSTRHLLSALSDMRREGAHMAIVIDEYGGTAGIITLEDLVEELVGDIRDEYDEHEPGTARSLTGEVEVDGLLNLDDFEDETGLVLPAGPYETAAGYIVQQLGHVPVVGEAAVFEGHRLTVTELDGRRIARVRVETAGPDEQVAATEPVAAEPLAATESVETAPVETAPVEAAPVAAADPRTQDQAGRSDSGVAAGANGRVELPSTSVESPPSADEPTPPPGRPAHSSSAPASSGAGSTAYNNDSTPRC